jgi:HSP20 family protein
MGIIVRRGNNDDFFRTFRGMQRDIDSVFDNFFADPRGYSDTRMMPRVDIFTNEKEYVFEFELPGFKKEDVKINIDDHLLTVAGEVSKEETEEDEKKNYHVSERRYGAFKRQFNLPEDSDVTAVDASYENGILTLKIQKKAEEKKQTIDIEIK